MLKSAVIETKARETRDQKGKIGDGSFWWPGHTSFSFLAQSQISLNKMKID